MKNFEGFGLNSALAQGASLYLISPQDGQKWRPIEQLIDSGKKSPEPVDQTFKANKRRRHRGRRYFYHQGQRAAA